MKKRKKDGKQEQSLSPKKLVETRARNLELYRCYVNVNWRAARIAHVIVMRKHVNQHVTAGIYLVDLLCLGVKDTLFYYNEPEETIHENILDNPDYEMDFDRIDYQLAHNIIYAGHDFAMDYGIKPHPDFATTRFILEEDNDEVPLIEIEVGDDERKPALFVNYPGQYADALQKLRKNAGEGNYTYIVVDAGGDDKDYDDDDGLMDESGEDNEDDISDSLDDYETGEIGPYVARMLNTSDLMNSEKIQAFDDIDRRSMHIELLMRAFFESHESYLYEDGPEFEWIEDMLTAPENISEDSREEFEAQIDYIHSFITDNTDDSLLEKRMLEVLTKCPSNIMLAITTHGFAILFDNDLLYNKTNPFLESYAPSYPVARLTLSLGSLIKGQDIKQYNEIYEQDSIHKLFPNIVAFSTLEIFLFFLIKVVWHSRNDHLEKALKYYQLVSSIKMLNWFVLPVQAIFADYLNKKLIQLQSSTT